MKNIPIHIQEATYLQMAKIAKKLDTTVESLAGEIIDKYLQSTCVEDTADGQDRRTTPRIKLDKSAILYFKTKNGQYGLYKSGDLKDISSGGVLLECDTQSAKELFKPGNEFELIFQTDESTLPLHVLCKICRVQGNDYKARIGVAFSELNEESSKTILDMLN